MMRAPARTAFVGALVLLAACMVLVTVQRLGTGPVALELDLGGFTPMQRYQVALAHPLLLACWTCSDLRILRNPLCSST